MTAPPRPPLLPPRARPRRCCSPRSARRSAARLFIPLAVLLEAPAESGAVLHIGGDRRPDRPRARADPSLPRRHRPRRRDRLRLCAVGCLGASALRRARSAPPRSAGAFAYALYLWLASIGAMLVARPAARPRTAGSTNYFGGEFDASAATGARRQRRRRAALVCALAASLRRADEGASPAPSLPQ